MTDYWLDWNGDLIIAQDGRVQEANGWDRVRQRIIRRMVTTPARTLPTGVQTPAGYIYHPDFGFGMGAMVDGDFTPDFLEQMKSLISQAVFVDQDVDATIPPSIKFIRPVPSTLWIIIGVTLTTGVSGTISIKMG